MKKSYIDNIRFITVFLVVIYHVIYIFNGLGVAGGVGGFSEKQPQDAFLYLVYPWFMSLLFVISGMCSRYALEQKGPKEFIKARTTKLLVPSTIGLFVFQWIQGYYNMAIGHAFESMDITAMPKILLWMIFSLSGTGVLWYIQLLWLFSLLLVVIRKIEKGRLLQICEAMPAWILLLCTVLFWGFAQILNTPVVVVYRFGVYGFSFFMGYFVFSHEAVIEKLTKWWCVLLISAVILGILYVCVYFGQNYSIDPIVKCPLACIFGWISILAVISNMKKWMDYSTAVTRFLSKKSWGLYIFHYLPLTVIAYYLTQSQIKLWLPLYYIFALVASVVGGYILFEIISRIPVLRWCILGMKKGQN